jgi:hypothetical protein
MLPGTTVSCQAPASSEPAAAPPRPGDGPQDVGHNGDATPAWCADPLDAHAAAVGYYREGRTPIRVPPRSKNPGTEGWQRTRYESEECLDRAFPTDYPSNIGLLCGDPSGGLLDADLDCPEAVALADTFLPPTARVSGRPNNPDSHKWYQAVGAVKGTVPFADPTTKEKLVELRSTGGHTLVPPSVHDEDGDQYVWHDFGEPTRVEYTDLHAAVGVLAAASLLARHWPPNPAAGEHGCRQDTALALAGGLARAGWAQERIERFVAAVATAAGDPDVKQRLTAVGHSVAKAAAGDKVVGWPTLAELVGDKAVAKVREWLGLSGPDRGGGHAPSADGVPGTPPPAAGAGHGGPRGKDILLVYLREKYPAKFRRGGCIYSGGREVSRTEAIGRVDSQLIERLSHAIDAPRLKPVGEDPPRVDYQRLPAFAKSWAPTAWGDYFGSLDDEPDCAEVDDLGADEFRSLVAGALHSIVSLVVNFKRNRRDGREAEDSQAENRSLLHWAWLFAKRGPWKSVRSYLLWFRLDDKDQLVLALHPDLFKQKGVHAGRLQGMTLRKFAPLAVLNSVGTCSDDERPTGKRAVVLDREFIDEILGRQNLPIDGDSPRESSREENCGNPAKSTET